MSNTATVESTVLKALEEFGADPDLITRDAEFEVLDVDSLDLAELVQIVEDDFGVQIKTDDMKTIKTVGDVIDFIVARA